MARAEPPDPGLPIKLGPCSNGEFETPPPSEVAREAIRRANEAVSRNARRLGISRRDFLRTSMGAATALTALSACARDSGQTGGQFVLDSDPTTSFSSSTSLQPEPASTMEPEAAEEAIGPLRDEFIFDIQGHLLEFGPGVEGGAPGFPQSACGEAEQRDCYDIEHFLDLLFLESDTHMVMLSAIPFATGALSPDVMEQTMAAAARLGCEDRVLMQGESFPTSLGIDAMAEVAANYPIRAFKTYTHTGGSPWRLDDDTGAAYFAQVESVGVPIVAVHKGLSGNDPASSPEDVGPASVAHPDVSILVYHSGYENGFVEGPYDPQSGDTGVDRLITSLRDSGREPGGNVYAELGSTWRALMSNPDQAAHVLGKLLLAVGEDNVLWGTDSIWYGSPQDQIQAFRVFEISDELQERFGYPALTADVKRKILGYNAARLFGIEPSTEPCRFSREELLGIRAELTTTHHTHAEAANEVYTRAL
jgi:predicted TIM-barrel fold metal-dependent hydrolase